MNISIEMLSLDDLTDLYLFEQKNRVYFEQMVPSRGEEYYLPEIFNSRNKTLLEEQARGESYIYLIKQDNAIIGRINLVDIDKKQKRGELGYRIGEVNTGKGIASLALQMLLQTISWEEINQVDAKTTTNNIPSQKVLEKNGFQKISSHKEFYYMNGEKIEFISYRKEVEK
ncbi:GNAT family N-acetyltransferase [Psychrobacillus sp. FSL K6-1267]|uniref:GNAT family N-acetyltransferase n=1 Tax=Psychrobacillus sp. FSL K6-1267 TaxID=2921543 RepID=UPI0030F8484B